MQIEDRRSNRNHILEMLIPFFGVFEPYKISIIPVTAIILFVIIVSRGRMNFKITKQTQPYLMFVGYMVLRDVLHMFFSVSDPIGTQFNRLLESVVLYALIFVACNNDFDEGILFRWWKIAGVIFGVGMLYHVFQLFVLGQEVYPISVIPGYDIAHVAGETSLRPTSFFSEPAAYVVSMMPLLFLSLKRKSLKWSALSTFLIVVSTSTVGVILSAVLWMVFILSEKKSLRISVLYTSFVVLFVALFLYLPVFSDTLQKLEDVSAGESTWGSRVKGPFQMIAAMNWGELPFGTDILDFKEFVFRNLDKIPVQSVPYQRVMSGDDAFFNTIALIIFRYGIVGLFLYLRMFKGKLFNRRSEFNMYAIMMIVASFGQGSISSPSIPMIVLLLYANRKVNQDNKELITLKGN